MRTLVVLAIVAVICAIPLYFSTRDQDRAASWIEWAAATAWLWFRRLLCFGFAAGCFVMAYAFTFGDATPSGGKSPVPIVIGVLVFGLFAVYVGIVGQGPRRTQFQDDLELHARNKRRYRWWF